MTYIPENNAIWVNPTMKRLESKFNKVTTKKIRMKCQCGYGMDKKFELVKELMELSSSLEKFGSLQKAKDAGLFYENNLIVWKCVCCLSSFRTQGSIEALNQILNNSKNDIIKCESKRSLKLIGENYEI